MSILPLEILTDIFLQLPVKSLGRCSCVCKSWSSLISNPEFAKYHINQAISGENKLGLILVPRTPLLGLEPRFGFENIDVNGDADLLDPNELVDFELPQIDFEIVGSCNGLICVLYFPNQFVVWNPTMKESMHIPHSPNSVDEYGMLFYGFGYDSSVDDYKLVRSVRSNKNVTNLMEIYSLKANSWRCIEDASESFNIDIETKNGTFLNESLHWVASRGMNQDNEYKSYDAIVVFDIKSESFSLWEIIAPRYNRCYQLTLGVLRGCLSLYSYEEITVIMVWVMKDYGVSKSWTWLTNLVLNEFFYSNYVTPVCYARGDELIMDVDGDYLVRYNLNTYAQKVLKLCSEDWFSCVIYVESLVSPNRYNIIP